jgi:type IV pilus assembly protein PilA
MRFATCLLIIAACAVNIRAEIAENYRGDWLLVNGMVVLHITAEGTMTLRNSGVKGSLTISNDGAFIWNIPESSHTGRFTDGKLYLKNDQPESPKWMEYLEFRRGSKEEAGEVIEFALRQQNQVAGAFERVRRTSMEKAILNNLRQLSAAADQFFLEYGTHKVTIDQIVGPDKYIKKLNEVDGEDYTKLDLTQGATPWKIVSASGITVTYER